MTDITLDGIIPILPTPFLADDSIDWQAIQNLVDFAFQGGNCAVCLPAYASEFYKLSEAERREVVARAVTYSDGRIPVIAQVNFPSVNMAIESAKAAMANGASAICCAVPRIMAMGETDIFTYYAALLEAVDLPFLIQDFNPGGPTLSPSFLAKLNSAYPHFRYIKLEEPLMAAKVKAIIQATSGKVGVLEGWGGMYMLELIPAGIAGVMPGLGVSDVLALAFRQVKAGNLAHSFETFKHVCPQIVFSLQSMELFHHAEKRLLQARGILPAAHVRRARIEIDADDSNHIDFLNNEFLLSLDQLGLARNPALSVSQLQ